MREITREAFTAAPDTADWGIVYSGPCALYRVASYRAAIDLLDAAAGLATLQLEPEFELRARAVLVRLPAPDRRIDSQHLQLAQAITRLARERNAAADPAGIQDVQIALDAADEDAARAFWGAALGYEPMRASHLRSPDRFGPTFFINDKPYQAPRNRFHVDISLPPDQAPARVAAIVAAGGPRARRPLRARVLVAHRHRRQRGRSRDLAGARPRRLRRSARRERGPRRTRAPAPEW